MRPGSWPAPRSQRPSPSRSPSTASGGCRCSRSRSAPCCASWSGSSSHAGRAVTPPRRRCRRSACPGGPTTAWILVLVFGLQSMQFYGVSAWIPNVYIERGWTVAAAGALVAVFNGVGLLTTVGVPLVADRLGARRPQLLVAAVIGTLAFVGIALVPDPAYLWVAILGLALGAIFPLVLTLPLDVADDAARVGSVAALMLLGGYVLSSVGPVLLGAARDLTGSFEASLWLLAIVGVVLAGELPAPLAGAAPPGHRTRLKPASALRRRPRVGHLDGVPPRAPASPPRPTIDPSTRTSEPSVTGACRRPRTPNGSSSSIARASASSSRQSIRIGAVGRLDRGPRPPDRPRRLRSHDHLPIARGVERRRQAGDVPVHPVDHRAVGVVVEREHVALLALVVARQRAHRARDGSSRRAGSRPSAPRPSSRPARPGTATTAARAGAASGTPRRSGPRRTSAGRTSGVPRKPVATRPSALADEPRQRLGDARRARSGGAIPKPSAAAQPVCVVSAWSRQRAQVRSATSSASAS